MKCLENNQELYYFDDKTADKAVNFFEKCLTHYQGKWAGKPFLLEPWQKQIIQNIFGWKRKSDGLRRYREVYIEAPRKSGKSTLCAALALYLLFIDGEKGGSVISAAADRNQASICFETAKQFIIGSPLLRKRAQIYRHSITYEATNSSYKVVSSESKYRHGENLSAAIIDELHCLPNRELYDVIKTSTGARQQPLVVSITTAGWDRNSICFELHEYAEKVLEGIIPDDTFYPVIFAADKEDDWESEDVWKKAQPNLDVTVSMEYYRQEHLKAIESPAYENTFRRLLLSQWTEQSVRWINMDKWDSCDETVDVKLLEGRECWAGLDLSSTIDISALVLLFPWEDGKYVVMPYFWIPSDNAVRRERRDRVPYITWQKQGFIETTDGNVIDYDVIRKRINELNEVYDIKELAIDRWNSTQLQSQLVGDGFDVVPFGQGYHSMSSPTKELERLILGKQLIHNGNPVMRWMISNVSIKQDAAANLKPDKARSSEKIDGVVSLIMALGRAMLSDSTVSSNYQERGIITI